MIELGKCNTRPFCSSDYGARICEIYPKYSELVNAIFQNSFIHLDAFFTSMERHTRNIIKFTFFMRMYAFLIWRRICNVLPYLAIFKITILVFSKWMCLAGSLAQPATGLFASEPVRHIHLEKLLLLLSILAILQQLTKISKK